MEISDSLRHFVQTTFFRGAAPALTDTTPLLSSGLLDSTDALELLLFIESEFDITVSDDESGPENLDTLERMSAFIAARQREQGVARTPSGEEAEPRAR